MNKTEIYHYLSEQKIAYEVNEHKAVFTMDELDSVELPYPEWDAKNLFIRMKNLLEIKLVSIQTIIQQPFGCRRMI